MAAAAAAASDPFATLAPALQNIHIQENNEKLQKQQQQQQQEQQQQHQQQHQQQEHEQKQEQEHEQKQKQNPEEFIGPDIAQNIQNKLILNKIEKQIFKIKQCYFNPQTLTIQGYNLLNHTPENHWKSRLYTLFSDACLPHYYIIDCWKDPSNNMMNDIPNVIHIQLITYLAKMFVKETLIHFLTYSNFNINVID